MTSNEQLAVLVPLKAFDRAKGRLAERFGPAERAALARAMAHRVLAAATRWPTWVVCDDTSVAAWAETNGAEVEWTPGHDLNGALQHAAERRSAEGAGRVVVVHADLPYADELDPVCRAGPDEVVLVPDRHRAGTNVASIPTSAGFAFAFGVGSFERHRAEARRCGLPLRVELDERLRWDIDEPGDLEPPAALGPSPAALVASQLAAEHR